MVRVSQWKVDKTLAGKSVRRQTSGDNGVEYGKLRQESGKIVSSRYVHTTTTTKPRTTDMTVLLIGKRNSIIPRKKRKTEM